jgi:hypothetical protein
VVLGGFGGFGVPRGPKWHICGFGGPGGPHFRPPKPLKYPIFGGFLENHLKSSKHHKIVFFRLFRVFQGVFNVELVEYG